MQYNERRYVYYSEIYFIKQEIPKLKKIVADKSATIESNNLVIADLKMQVETSINKLDAATKKVNQLEDALSTAKQSGNELKKQIKKLQENLNKKERVRLKNINDHRTIMLSRHVTKKYKFFCPSIVNRRKRTRNCFESRRNLGVEDGNRTADRSVSRERANDSRKGGKRAKTDIGAWGTRSHDRNDPSVNSSDEERRSERNFIATKT